MKQKVEVLQKIKIKCEKRNKKERERLNRVFLPKKF